MQNSSAFQFLALDTIHESAAKPIFAENVPDDVKKVRLPSRLEGRCYGIRPRKSGGGAVSSSAPPPMVKQI
jgi:hypothetical protein